MADDAFRTVVKHNLPAQTTPFIGRQEELAQVVGLLCSPQVRLLTLTGMAGTGKTRLALEAAASLLGSFADGVFLVPLAPLADPKLVGPTMVRVLGTRQDSDRTPLDALKLYLRDRQLLLVLDNFEQVVAAAPLVAELLAECQGLKILVTSRVRLRVYGEYVWHVPPLHVPPNSLPARIGDIERYDAVQLLVSRIAAVRPGFVLDPANAATVAELCRRLEGLPLSLELAAGRAGILSVQALLARIERRLDFLNSGPRDQPERMQSLRGTIEWSFALLTGTEQVLFSRLGVFVGGCTLAAIEAVCATPPNPSGESALLELVVSLAEKSLLLAVESGDGSPRFTMLETLREFAYEKLSQRDELDQLRERHADYYLELAETSDRWLRGPEEPAWLELLDHEHDNMRAAARLFAEHGSAERGLRLVAALGRYWQLHGHHGEARRWAAQALSLPGAEERNLVRSRALRVAGRLARLQADLDASASLLEENLLIRQELDDGPGIGDALNELGILALERGDLGQARRYFEQSLPLRREFGDAHGIVSELNNLAVVAVAQGDNAAAHRLCNEGLDISTELGDSYGVALLKGNMAGAFFNEGDYSSAKKLYRESLRLYQAFGDKSQIAGVIGDLGVVAHREGDLTTAEQLLAESLAIKREAGDRAAIGWLSLSNAYLALDRKDPAAARTALREGLDLFSSSGSRRGLAETVAAVGQYAATLGHPLRAAQLFGAAMAGLDACAAQLQSAYAHHYRAAARTVRGSLGRARFNTSFAEGAALSPDELYRLALQAIDLTAKASQEAATKSAPATGELSEREVAVLRLVAHGMSNTQVAAQLILSPYTVNAHLRSIYRKLGLASRATVIQFAIEHQLL